MACIWSLDNTQVPLLAPMHGATRATENLENCFNFQQTIYLPVTFLKAFFFFFTGSSNSIPSRYLSWKILIKHHLKVTKNLKTTPTKPKPKLPHLSSRNFNRSFWPTPYIICKQKVYKYQRY